MDLLESIEAQIMAETAWKLQRVTLPEERPQTHECQNEVGLKNMQILPKQSFFAEVCKINVVSSLRKLFHWFFFYLKAELFLFRILFTDLVSLNAIDTKSDEYYRRNSISDTI